MRSPSSCSSSSPFQVQFDFFFFPSLSFFQMDICRVVSESNKRAATATAGDYIGDDLVIEILSRLPPKPLSRFKCVSKTWLQLASSIILHSQMNNPFSGFFIRLIYLCRYSKSIRYESIRYLPVGDDDDVENCCTDHTLSFLPSHPHTTILDSRHGFLLCSSFIKNNNNNNNIQNNNNNYYYLCNPVTRQWLSITHPPHRASRNARYAKVNVNVALVFDDPSYDLSQKYRIFRFTSGLSLDMGPSAEYEAEEEDDDHPSVLDLCVDIYSSETGQWVKSKASFKRGPYFALLERPTVLLDGAIFLSGAPIYVLRFDIEEERFDFIRLPDDLSIPVYTRLRLKEAMTCLGLCQGRLYYACHNWSHIQLWMFDDCEPSKWVLTHGVELQVFRSINPTLVDDRIALDVLGLEEDPVPLDILAFHPLLDAVFVRILDGFYWYHAQSRKLEIITSCSPWTTADMRFRVYRIHPFSEWYSYQRF
ncbi:hypothetical protein AAC387_Pa07g2320 [Persea americana]